MTLGTFSIKAKKNLSPVKSSASSPPSSYRSSNGLEFSSSSASSSSKSSKTAAPSTTLCTTVITKQNLDAKVGISFACYFGSHGDDASSIVYIQKIQESSLAAQQTDLRPGVQVLSVNGVAVETSAQAAVLIRTTADHQITIVTLGNYVTACAPTNTNKWKKKNALVAGLSLMTTTTTTDGLRRHVHISKVNPKGLFPTLSSGLWLLAVNGIPVDKAETAAKLLQQATTALSTSKEKTLELVVALPKDQGGKDSSATTPRMVTPTANTSASDDFSFAAKSSTVSTELMTATQSVNGTVRSYSMANELDLMEKVGAQMKDDDYTTDDVSSVISEMTNDEEDNKESSSTSSRPQQQQPGEEQSTSYYDYLVSEPSSFSCLDQHMEEFLPENAIHDAQLSAEVTTVTVQKPPNTVRAGLRLRKSNPIDSILICGIAPDGLFLHSDLRVGQKILTINGLKCPNTTSECVQIIKNTTGDLTIEAVDVDWDATLSDAWAAESSSASK